MNDVSVICTLFAHWLQSPITPLKLTWHHSEVKQTAWLDRYGRTRCKLRWFRRGQTPRCQLDVAAKRGL